jgi:hypothetical protein
MMSSLELNSIQPNGTRRSPAMEEEMESFSATPLDLKISSLEMVLSFSKFSPKDTQEPNRDVQMAKDAQTQKISRQDE